ncbi:MAG TPA: hypothetical protein VFA60_13460 [Terriglobales bacterium]|nr:hypothetical protein [Terriglobales bacterium]
MKSMLRLWKLSALLLLVLFCVGAMAQEQEREEAAPAPSKSTDPLENLKFRNLGPTVGGGRVTAVVGVPGKPNIYYAGAAAGGVFKSVDGGLSWKPIFEKYPPSIGAIALAPSNPNLIWVGTGEANIRNDVVTGKGVYFSPDAGASWRFMGLGDAGQISSIVIHPADPNIVLVGVQGHAWGPNKDRGVFRTTDGGKTWTKTLFVDDSTGVAALVMDPNNPLVLFASTWQATRRPWMFDDGGPNSGVWRSTDGGVTWTRLTEGLPKVMSRIGLAIAKSNSSHIYALGGAKKGRLWESKDNGDHWTEVSDRHVLAARPWYFSQVYVAPDREDRLYFLSFDILQSDDGGKNARNIGRGVHPDHHSLWIDPTQPERMIEGNDGGVYVTGDGGKTWRFLDNLPIEQFYMVAHDDDEPYLLCGGLQDNNGWCGPSNSLSRGGIPGSLWWTATGGDGEYVVPAPGKSNIIYADSQNGFISRFDKTNGRSISVRPYLHGVGSMAPADLKYRFNWTSPIGVDRKDANTVYLGANVLFKSTDAGAHWQPISPDLTRNDKTKQASSGGQILLDLSGAETYGTILSFSIAPTDANVIWVGTDDGLVQMTKDGGAHWTNVTPKGAPEWARIQQIDVSPFSPESAYVAYDAHQLDNNKPYVYRTHDGGKTWTAIIKGLPDDEPARVVRENPNRKGFLVLGTDTGLYFSMNDGDDWKPLKGNFPNVPVYDVKFHKDRHDLIVATHGRGLFVLDNIVPLEEQDKIAANTNLHVFTTLPARRWQNWNRGGFNSSATPPAPNPPPGVVVQYWLKSALETTPEMRRRRQTPVKITVTDAAGQKVRTFYGTANAGFNRVSWDMTYDGATRLDFQQQQESEFEAEFFPRSGPPVVPGSFKITVSVGNDSQTTVAETRPDPRFNIPMEVFAAQTKAALELRDEVTALNTALNRLESMHTQLLAVQRFLSAGNEEGGVAQASYQPVMQQARALDRKLRGFEEKIFNTELQQGGSDTLHYLDRFQQRLQGLMFSISGRYGVAPTELEQEEMATLRKQLESHLAEFNALLKGDVNDFNKLALDKGASTLFAGNPIELKGADAQAGGSK